MKKFEATMDKAMRFLMAMSMLSLVIGGFWQIFTRWVLNNPSTQTEEFMRYMLIWASMIGSAYCFYKDQHLALDLFKNKAKGKVKFGLAIFIETCILGFVLYVLVYGGFRLASSATNSSPVMQIPFSVLYAVLPLSGLFIVLARIIRYVDLYQTKKGGKQ